MTLRCLLVALAVLGAGRPLAGRGEPPGPAKISGMWVWSENSYKTADQRTRLIQFCQEYGFNHLDASVRVEKRAGRMAVAEPAELADLLARAAAAKISVCALHGSQRMFYRTNWTRTIEELRTVMEFNRHLPAAARLEGFKYDVEPQTTDEWRKGGAVRQTIMLDYLDCLVQMNELLAAGTNGAPRMKLTVDIPFWWDKPELAIELAGQTKLFSQHIQDLTDSLTLMSYRRDPEQVKRLVENEREYAVKIGKQVLPGLLQSQARNPAEAALSFYGLPNEDYLRVRRQLEDWAAGEPGIGGVMHHHYASLSNALTAAVRP